MRQSIHSNDRNWIITMHNSGRTQKSTFLRYDLSASWSVCTEVCPTTASSVGILSVRVVFSSVAIISIVTRYFNKDTKRAFQRTVCMLFKRPLHSFRVLPDASNPFMDIYRVYTRYTILFEACNTQVRWPFYYSLDSNPCRATIFPADHLIEQRELTYYQPHLWQHPHPRSSIKSPTSLRWWCFILRHSVRSLEVTDVIPLVTPVNIFEHGADLNN